ncbi:type II toxin-antitoxin system RelE/ParE family toxin [uncultured Sphingomonas sp.]|uniref:type II toxin-antitoxin system RelE/ParE family toxin n=1 Tax=uncultured Sphingomonas sp. TaxID=158754 RepID=UPI0025DD0155|nr:type II toxin-antitoxin system RelE/ParE family toxin [uncultured Sphingomonas sp.]
MSGVFIEPAADRRLDEIYEYTADQWGEDQADAYIRTLFERFGAIAAKRVPWRPLPAEFGVPLYFARAEHHIVYWRERADGVIGIVTILHERMHQLEQLRAVWEP